MKRMFKLCAALLIAGTLLSGAIRKNGRIRIPNQFGKAD